MICKCKKYLKPVEWMPETFFFCLFRLRRWECESDCHPRNLHWHCRRHLFFFFWSFSSTSLAEVVVPLTVEVATLWTLSSQSIRPSLSWPLMTLEYLTRWNGNFLYKKSWLVSLSQLNNGHSFLAPHPSLTVNQPTILPSFLPYLSFAKREKKNKTFFLYYIFIYLFIPPAWKKKKKLFTKLNTPYQ